MASREKQLMQEFRKHWLSLGVALFSSLGSQGAAADDNATFAEVQPRAITLARAGGEGEGLGEGEGEGEGEGTQSPEQNIKHSDVAYLSRLGLIRGHLLAGFTLYQQGHADMAATHMKHPEDELFTNLEAALQHRNAPPFSEELSALSTAVTKQADMDKVKSAYKNLDEALQAVEARAQPSLRTTLLSIRNLVRTAGEEYAVGVRDGTVVNVHEYQDAWGFTQLARRRLDHLDSEQRATAPRAVARVEQLLADLDSLWPELAPGDTVDGDAARLFGAAARIEIAALDLQ